MPPALVVAPFLLGASAVDASTLFLGPLAFLLVAGVGYGWRFGDDGWDAFGRGFAGAAVGLPFGCLVAGLVFGVTNGFEFAHLGALLVALSMIGSVLLLLLLPYAVAAGLAGAVVARL